MKIKLNKSFAANAPADEYDVRQIKKALNRLGYYTPYEKTGITGIPDTAVFAALKSFQKDQGLRATGTAKPDDETVAKLEQEATKKKSGKYIWRTVGDEKVREGHAAFNGTIRDLADSPDPGEEFNCRCWAEPLTCGKESIAQNVISLIKDDKYKWTWADYLAYFYVAQGVQVTLPDMGWLGAIIDECKKQVFIPVQEQVVALARQIGQGPLHYTTEKTYEFEFVSYPIGGATVRTETNGTVIPYGECLIIDAEVEYTFFDDFTDPVDLREGNDHIQDIYIPQGFPPVLKQRFKRGDWTELGGTPYHIHGNWKTKLSGIVKRVR